ncbi:helix-turn-helix transcriptional regulator, partial [Mycobacterium sp.]|uniref:helix-turn-helix transcriptional regulator n=1 Tax=Mycobacterium sp. TaxID=1785 RepID=UPI002DA3444C|nr:helix-turn-helix transcriptional regulator [Mycobacterium sp.]
GVTHPMRSLLGDVARSTVATTLALAPLSLEATAELVGDCPVDPVWLHRITDGNAFFIVEMLDHIGEDLPTTVRDAILARTVGLEVAAWDVLYLLACAPQGIPDYLLSDLGVTVPALRALNEAKLIRRTDRGVAFRHDLCRLAVVSVIPPGAEVEVHRRLIHAYETVPQQDPAVLTHHALGAGDRTRVLRAAFDAGTAAARAGAHTQAAEFYQTALSEGGVLPSDREAELLELLADEYYLTDRLDDAIAARRRALDLRESLGAAASVSANHHALALYESFNANLSTAEHHAAKAVAVLDGQIAPGSQLARGLLGNALATQAYFAVMSSDLRRADALLSQARECVEQDDDPALAIRVAIIEGYSGGLAGEDDARDRILSSIRAAAELFEDAIHAYGCTILALLDIEQRRLDQLAEPLDISISVSVERDAPFVWSWLRAVRARLELLVGDWDDAAIDADTVLGGPSAPLARSWPLVVRTLISLRRDGAAVDGIDDAWRAYCTFGEHMRLFPAAAIAEQAWLTGTPDDRLDACRTLLDSCPVDGANMAIGDLAMWLHRIDPSIDADRATGPYRMLLDGAFEAAADEFHRLSMPYEAALALVDSGDVGLARRGLDVLDRLGAAAVAAKVRRDLRSSGLTVVPARRRSTTLTNAAGLTSRQVEVLRLIDEGLTNAELADRLYLSVRTVDHHVAAILAKLDVSGRRDAIRKARELGILS